MNPRVGFFFLIPVALFVLSVLVLAFNQTEPKRPASLNPLRAHGPCRQQVWGPTQRWYCSRPPQAWDRYPDGHWQRAGRLTPLPQLPSSN